MKLVSWNVNGLRAIERKQADEWLWQNDFDIIALQETKSNPDQLSDYLLSQAGYSAYFDSSTLRKGYSGVALYIKDDAKHQPKEIINGLGIKEFDEQGRLLTAIYDGYIVCNGYFPNGGSKTASLEYKLSFYDTFLDFIESYRKDGYKVIFGGDLNVAHNAIDLARPEANVKNTGFLPIERAWVDRVIEAGYSDVFRYLNPKKAEVYTYWDMKSRARDRNVGWRIDYWFVSNDLLPMINAFDTKNDILGSDHCPIVIDINL